LALRPCGRRRLRAELRARGVAASVAEDAIQSLLSGDAESELAMEQARGRLGHFRGVPEVVARRRLAGWLQRRGFAPDVVARTLRALHLAPTGDRDADPAA
jgi:regulatory protein